MASNTYASANITPASDTFREWVSLTNRITFDMEKVVVTTIANTEGACTSGNAYVNGFFSANTLLVEDKLQGVSANSTVFGTKAAAANLIVSSNLVLIANSTANAILHAKSNSHFTGALLQSNATLNDFNSNVDIDNALTDIAATKINLSGTSANITSTTLTIDGTTLDLNSNVDLDAANVNVDATKFDLTGTTANLHSTTTTIKGTTLDVDSNVDIDSASVTIDGGTLAVGSILDQNANVDIDNGLTDITSTDFNVSGTNTLIDSTNMNIHGTSLDINSNTNIDGDITTTANATIGNANSDLLTVTANAVFSDKIKVTKTAQFDSDVTVDGHTTLNGNTVIGDAIGTDQIKLNALVNTAILPSTNGTLSIGNTVNRWDGNFDDLNADELTVIQDATIGGDTDITGEVNAATAAIVGLATIGGNVVVSGDIDGANNKEANVFNAVVRNDLTVSTNTVLNGNVTINSAKDFIVGNSTYKAIQSNVSSNVKIVSIGSDTTSNSRVTFNSVVTGNSTVTGLMPMSNVISLGNSTARWIMSANTLNVAKESTLTGDVSAGANLAVAAESKAATLNVTSTSAMGGRLTISSGGAGITGPLDTVNNANVGGNAAVTGVLAVTGAATLANTITVTGAADFNKTGDFAGNVNFQDSITVADNSTFSKTLGAGNTTVTGFANVTSTLEVAGATTLKGNVDLGDAATDTVSFVADVDTNILPNANGLNLGAASARWDLIGATINTSGDVVAGADVDITGEANTSTLKVRSTTALTGNLSFSSGGTAASLTANSSQSRLDVGYVQAANLVITGSAVLPNNTTLTATGLGAADLTVTNTALFNAAGAGDFVQFGNGSDRLDVRFANAVVNGHVLAATTDTYDIGSAALSFRKGFFDTSVTVGDTVANTTALLANNVYATDDLVASFSSDHKLKDHVVKIDTALDKVESIGGYQFVWNNNIGDMRAGTHDYGVIAQEIEDVLPHAVDINSRGHKTVNYNNLIPLLVEAVKELSARVKELEPEPEEEHEEDIDG